MKCPPWGKVGEVKDHPSPGGGMVNVKLEAHISKEWHDNMGLYSQYDNVMHVLIE